ncbi:MAG: FkbM family methyltransferase [Gomphosphaeria aponina SAG 52.96 = DSM 107014]|uniref:FkbM family methyltransferase n=1 Tax=Gomphosphaeria aponina SAG 52.96 = DSM 107014 TaxID=1521640 RepID=A0A941GW60_9CHRO|nr:FkbM family methyltransferase [Gomphosphaeria aponina SAG 52.96 = DSM 107014]
MIEPKECIVASNVHGMYCVPPSSKHRPACQHIIQGKVWEANTIEFMVQNCGLGDIVHAGIFFGDFLPALSRNLRISAKIWAFEPIAENFHCAEWTVRINNLTNVNLNNFALSNTNSVATFQVQDETGKPLGGASHFTKKEIKDEQAEKISCKKLDDLIPSDREVSIIQLDVEGHEAQALAGGINLIKRCLPIIILEQSPRKWIEQNLSPLGYEEVGKVHINNIWQVK